MKRMSQDVRRAEVKISIDKIRKQLTVVDINVGPKIKASDIQENYDACAAIKNELRMLIQLVSGLRRA